MDEVDFHTLALEVVVRIDIRGEFEIVEQDSVPRIPIESGRDNVESIRCVSGESNPVDRLGIDQPLDTSSGFLDLIDVVPVRLNLSGRTILQVPDLGSQYAR